MKTSNNTAIKVAFISGLVCLLVYLRALTCGFVDYDDPQYVLNNPIIRNLDWNFIGSIFTRTYENWWMPLTWISLAIDYHFWELNPFGYHLTNILLHAINTGLVVLIADKILSSYIQRGEAGGGKKATFNVEGVTSSFFILFSGLLWGLHPLRIESVVWITERKDVLNGFFALLSIFYYLHYVPLKDSGRVKMFSGYYLLTVGFFILSLMAKSGTVVMPLLLLLLDWYPLGRLNKDDIKAVIIEKIPFFVISAVMAAGTVFSISEARYLISNENFTFGERVVVSGNALFEYCRLIFFPYGIIPIHFIPDPVPVAYSVKSAFFVLIMFLFLYKWNKWRGLTTVLLCFVILLLPVLAFFQNGDQSFASRFTYLPAVAPSFSIAFGFVSLCQNRERWLRFIILSFAAIALLFYIAVTQKLIPVWNSPETFWNRIVEVEPSAVAYKERAFLFVQMKKYDAAVDDYSAAIKNPLNVWKPYIYNLYAFRGVALTLAGRYDEAANDFTTAINIYPHPSYFSLRGNALQKSGKLIEAESDFKKAGSEIAPIAWYWIKAGDRMIPENGQFLQDAR